MNEVVLRNVKVPHWYRFKKCVLSPLNWWNALATFWDLRDFGWCASASIAWSLFWLLLEDYGCGDDEHTTWRPA